MKYAFRFTRTRVIRAETWDCFHVDSASVHGIFLISRYDEGERAAMREIHFNEHNLPGPWLPLPSSRSCPKFMIYDDMK
jgi:hypothetical protein